MIKLLENLMFIQEVYYFFEKFSELNNSLKRIMQIYIVASMLILDFKSLKSRT